MNNTLVSATSGSNPDIIIKHQFDLSRPSYISYLENHNGKDKTITDIQNDHDIVSENIAKEHGRYDDYVDYARKDYATALEEGVDEKLTTTFNADRLNLTKDEVIELKNRVKNAASKKNLMWKTVVSLSDDFLIEQQIMDNKEDRNLDQRRLKEMMQKSMPEFLKAEGIDKSAEWFGNIHLRGDINDEHIHIHLATFEEQTNRPDFYNPVTKQIEPRGLFKQKSLDSLKSSLWRNLKLDKNLEVERELYIKRQIASKELVSKVDDLQYWSEQKQLINALINVLPEKQTQWRSKSNAKEMQAANKLAETFVQNLLEKNQNNLTMFDDVNEELQRLYRKGYGESDSVDMYVLQQKKELEQKLINRLYKNLKNLDADEFVDKFATHEKLAEDHTQIKDVLEAQIKRMQDKNMVVPKSVKKELGKQKRAIQVENLNIKRANVISSQQELEELLETQVFDGDNVSEVKHLLAEQQEWLELKLTPNFKLSDDEKERQDQLDEKYEDVNSISVDKVNQTYVAQQKEQLNFQEHLIRTDPELYVLLAGINVEDVPQGEQVKYLLDNHHKQAETLTIKSTIYDNNQELKKSHLDKTTKDNLLKQNRALFKDLKNQSNNSDSEIKKKTLPNVNINKLGDRSKDALQSTLRKTQRLKLGSYQIKKLSSQLQRDAEHLNDGEERARDAFEQEQQRIKDKENER